MPYRVELWKRVDKQLEKFPKKIQRQLVARLDDIARDPYANSQVLQGYRNPIAFKQRSGDYRIVYTVYEERLLVIVWVIGDRRDVYSQLARFAKWPP